MSLLEETKLLLRRHRIVPNRLLGQNFMVEPSFFELMSGYASLGRNDVVLDVGAGLGFLTRFLANKCKCVLAVETDNRLVKVLYERLRDFHNISIIGGSVLKAHLPSFNKVVSIPPYQISSDLVVWLCEKGFESAVLIFQKEFACRLVALPGADDYGWIMVLTYYYAECELLDPVRKSMFYPEPRVDSVVTRLTLRKTPPFTIRDMKMFKPLLQSIFTERNRKVRNAVIPFLKGVCAMDEREARKVAQSLAFGDKRVRELAPEDFAVLANALID